MIVKTSELEGAVLDWAVAQIVDPPWGIGEVVEIIHPGETGPIISYFDGYQSRELFEPSENWADGGPLIEERNFVIGRSAKDYPAWHAKTDGKIYGGGNSGEGPTPLIAAMRAIVAAELGQEVDVPEGLA